MKIRSPQFSRITQIVEGRGRLWVARGYQTNAPQERLHRLCDLRNLQRKSVQENL